MSTVVQQNQAVNNTPAQNPQANLNTIPNHMEFLKLIEILHDQLVGMTSAAQDQTVGTDGNDPMDTTAPVATPDDETVAEMNKLKDLLGKFEATVQSGKGYKKLKNQVIKQTVALMDHLSGGKTTPDAKSAVKDLLGKTLDLFKQGVQNGVKAVEGTGQPQSSGFFSTIGGGVAGLLMIAVMELLKNGFEMFSDYTQQSYSDMNVALQFGLATAKDAYATCMDDSQIAMTQFYGALTATLVMGAVEAYGAYKSYGNNKALAANEESINKVNDIQSKLDNPESMEVELASGNVGPDAPGGSSQNLRTVKNLENLNLSENDNAALDHLSTQPESNSEKVAVRNNIDRNSDRLSREQDRLTNKRDSINRNTANYFQMAQGLSGLFKVWESTIDAKKAIDSRNQQLDNTVQQQENQKFNVDNSFREQGRSQMAQAFQMEQKISDLQMSLKA